MVFSEESIASTLEEAKPLLQKHWEETESHYGLPLDPDYNLYLRLEEQGLLKSYSARVHGILVGYAVFSLRYHHHYKTILAARQDIIFMLPPYRIHSGFLKWCKSQLKAAGAKVFIASIKATGRSFQEYCYITRLDAVSV